MGSSLGYLRHRRDLPPRPGSGADEQALAAQGDVVRLPPGLLDELEVREAVHQRGERDLQLLAAERRAEAEVDPRAEREVRVRVAGQVELVRLAEHLRVAVRRTEQESELGAPRDL